MPSGPGRGHRRPRARGRGRARRARPRRRPRGAASSAAGRSSSSSSRGSSRGAGSPAGRRPSTRPGCPSSRALWQRPRRSCLGRSSSGAAAQEPGSRAAPATSSRLRRRCCSASRCTHPAGPTHCARTSSPSRPTRRGSCRARTTASAPRPSCGIPAGGSHAAGGAGRPLLPSGLPRRAGGRAHAGGGNAPRARCRCTPHGHLSLRAPPSAPRPRRRPSGRRR